MPFDELELIKDLAPDQRLLFMNQMNAARKSKGTALLLTLLLGGIGGHHFYLGNNIIGLLYALTVWTFVPMVLAFLELFFISGRVEAHNENKAREIVKKIKTMFPEEQIPPADSVQPVPA